VGGARLSHAGELAALGTAVCWAAGSNFFASAARRMGSQVLNRLRISTAFVLLALTLLVTRGSLWPTWIDGRAAWLLALSGLVGFIFGDANYFRALVILGPGRASLLASTAPLFTTALAFPLLHEAPGRLAALGIALTVGGVALVVLERGRQAHDHVEGSVVVGVVCGILGAVGQAGGYVLSKLAIQGGADPLSATVVRIAAAAVGVWLLAPFMGGMAGTVVALRHRRSALFMVAGAILGPFLGVVLSLAALKTVQAGVAASIIASYPVLTMIIASRFQGERLTVRALGGAVVAAIGVAVLFMR
jgi:drug/metabolite transporter (DMT)-like permease